MLLRHSRCSTPTTLTSSRTRTRCALWFSQLEVSVQDNEIVIGIAWFQPESWKRLKQDHSGSGGAFCYLAKKARSKT